jgi:hypothetical protein
MESAPWTKPMVHGYACVIRRVYIRYKDTFYIVMLFPPTVNGVQNHVALVRGGNDGVVLQMTSSTEFTVVITSGVSLRIKIWVCRGNELLFAGRDWFRRPSHGEEGCAFEFSINYPIYNVFRLCIDFTHRRSLLCSSSLFIMHILSLVSGACLDDSPYFDLRCHCPCRKTATTLRPVPSLAPPGSRESLGTAVISMA